MALSNGQVVHAHCVLKIIEQISEFKKAIDSFEDYTKRLKREVKRRQSFEYKVISIFSKPEVSNENLKEQLSESESNLINLKGNLAVAENRLREIYDFYPTYPPDWEERRRIAIKAADSKCSSCGVKSSLHLHHRVPLSSGGTNRHNNLVVLCEKCHSLAHGGKDLSRINGSSNTAFEKRLEIIHTAIELNKRMTFGYKKPSDEKHHTRAVSPPYRLEQVTHHRDDGTTLCLRAHCELRKAERVFALKRMNGLKIM
jgi:hypothetical protein